MGKKHILLTFALANMSGFSSRNNVAHMEICAEDSCPAFRYMTMMSMISSSSSLLPCSSSASIRRSIMPMFDLGSPFVAAALLLFRTPCSTDTSFLRA